MNVIGKWKVKKIGVMQDNGELKYFLPEELDSLEDADEYRNMASAIYEFTSAGNLNTLMLIPPEMYEEATKEGLEVVDGCAIVSSTSWKEEDGKIYFDTKIEGEILGEPVDSFCEVPVMEDGSLNFMEMIILERM